MRAEIAARRVGAAAPSVRRDGACSRASPNIARPALAALTYIPGTSRDFDLDLAQPGRTMALRREYEDGPLIRTFRAVEPVAAGQLQLRIKLGVHRISTVDFLMIVLPVLMWLFAAIIGWLVLQRLLLRPLALVRSAVAAYRPGRP